MKTFRIADHDDVKAEIVYHTHMDVGLDQKAAELNGEEFESILACALQLPSGNISNLHDEIDVTRLDRTITWDTGSQLYFRDVELAFRSDNFDRNMRNQIEPIEVTLISDRLQR